MCIRDRVMLVRASSTFEFFAAVAFFTVGSYLLNLRGKKSEPPALSYIVFSLAGAFLILAGFALAANGAAQFDIAGLSRLAAPVAPWVFLLLAIGFMTKTCLLYTSRCV